MLFHILNIIFAWLGFGIDIVLVISIGLFAAFCFGFVTFYLSCEMFLILSRWDLQTTIDLVEENEALKKRSQYLQRTLIFAMPSRKLLLKRSICPCLNFSAQQNNANYANKSCCSLLYERIATTVTTCRMYSVIIYFLIVKPFIMIFTSFFSILFVFYALFLVGTPIGYLINSHQYKSGNTCVFGGTCSDDNTNCHCYGLQVNDFGVAFACGVFGYFLLPLMFRFSNGAAQFSKIVTYYFLTSYYSDKSDNENEQNQQLLYTNNV